MSGKPKTCSNCGQKRLITFITNNILLQKNRVNIDRDLNAANNLKKGSQAIINYPLSIVHS